MLIIMWYFNVKKYYQKKRKWMKSDCLVLMMDSDYGIIDGAYVFSSSFLRIVSRTSNMPFILMLSPWYVKYFQYHHITAWEAGRSERQKSRNVFHLTKCFFSSSGLGSSSFDLINICFTQGHRFDFYLCRFLFAVVEIFKKWLLLSF